MKRISYLQLKIGQEVFDVGPTKFRTKMVYKGMMVDESGINSPAFEPIEPIKLPYLKDDVTGYIHFDPEEDGETYYVES